MRIAIVESQGRRSVSGCFLRDMPLRVFRSEWESAGHPMSVFRLSPDKRAYGTGRSRSVGALSTLLRIAFGDYDVVWIRTSGFLVPGFLLRLLDRSVGIVVSFPFTDAVESDFANRPDLSRRIVRAIADRLVTTSESWKAGEIRDRYGNDPVRIAGAPIAVPVAKGEFLRTNDLREGRFILSVSEGAGQESLIPLVRVFRELEETGKMPNNFKLVIIGKLSFDPETEPYLKTAIGKRDSILLLDMAEGAVRREIFSHAAVFVQPAGREGSDALLEALGYGLPVLAGDSARNRERLGEAGEYYRDATSMRDRLSALLARPDFRLDAAYAARELFRRRFSPETDAAVLLELFGDVIGSGSGRKYIMKRTHRHA